MMDRLHIPSPTFRVSTLAIAWIAVFFVFHVYWYAGGSFGLAGPLPGMPDSIGGWVFQILVLSAFPLGAWACTAIARDSAQGRVRLAVAVVVWLGCALLLLRGGSGVVDELARASGALPNGITGLSREETMGTSDPSADALWSSRATDAYFLAGGLVFGLLAYGSRRNALKRRLLV